MNSLYSSRCDWCPRRCGVNRRIGQYGACGAADDLLIARAALHYWEEPPISGDCGSGAIFFSGCSLHCAFCQNSEISDGRCGKAVTLERLIEIYFELEAQGALNINLVTPTHYGPVIIESLIRAKHAGLKLPIVWNTSGYETVESIENLDGIVDVFLIDFKYYDSVLSKRYSNASDYRHVATAALEAMLLQVEADVIVRHLLLPGCLDDSKRVLDYLSCRFGTELTLSLMSQYTPHHPPASYPELSGTVSAEEYSELLDYADSLGFDEYFWQEGEPASESFIPLFDCTGV